VTGHPLENPALPKVKVLEMPLNCCYIVPPQPSMWPGGVMVRALDLWLQGCRLQVSLPAVSTSGNNLK